MRLLPLIAVLCVALLAPSSASAQSSDPEPSSPSGTVYEIPLEAGRGEAAPGGRSRGGGDSSIHSDNGFGSSPTVPGASGPAAGGGESSTQGTGAAAPEDRDSRERGGSGNDERGGSGSEERGGSRDGRGRPGESDIAEGDAADVAAPARVARQDVGSPSIPRAFLLLGLGVLVAVGLAAAARLAIRRR